ncbi:MAG: hypothetical protein AAB401_06395 [Acidobacteriota bacterium]
MQRLKHAFVGLLCGALTGAIVLGFGGRLMMRLISLLTGNPLEFSASGSLEVIAFGAIIGSAAGVVYYLIEKFLPANGWLKGALFGLLLFAVISVAQLPSVERSAAAFANFTALVAALFGLVFMIFGLSLAATMKVAGLFVEGQFRLRRIFRASPPQSLPR